MYLKYLAVEGFKSFPEWNGLELAPGVCVLVGQNGTGKSNLTDALSWVFGEDNPDALRVRGSEDVIFAGSEELLPAAAAAVTVVIDRRPERLKGESLPANVCKHGHRAEHSGELPDGLVTLTRRLSPSGEDTYLLNGSETSREEVHALLADVGLAFPPVCLIRQGELERLLLLGPAERRRIIEEAADVPHIAQRLEQLHLRREDLRLSVRAHEAEHREASLSIPQLLQEERVAQRRAELEKQLSTLLARALAAFLEKAGRADLAPELWELLELPRDSGSTAIPDQKPASGRPSDEPLRQLSVLREELKRVGPANARASEDLARAERRTAQLQQAMLEAQQRLTEVERLIQQTSSEMDEAFRAAHERIEERLKVFYSLLAPGGEAGLPLVPLEGSSTGVEVVARPPGKLLDMVASLSGGERSLAALSFALALFHESASPFFVLDEVEPALDDSNIRRVQKFLDRVADGRQLLVVSHQQRAKETGDVVFGIERNLDGASQVKFRYEPRSRRLDVYRRTWAAEHLRRSGARPAAVTAGGRSGQTVVGSTGSPTQSLFAELFGPASGAKRNDYFHEDGTFRGIWDAYARPGDEAPLPARTEPAGTPADESAGENPPPKCCC